MILTLRVICGLALAAGCATASPAQTQTRQRASSQRLQTVADSAYKAKNYAVGAKAYQQLARQVRFDFMRASPYYDAACCQALAGQTNDALRLLQKAVRAGYDNAEQVENDADLTSLRTTARYQKLLRHLKAQVVAAPADPDQAQLVTSDIDLFWQAYDHAQREPTRSAEIYDTEYFGRGSVGLQDYYRLKIRDTGLFVENQAAKPLFYRSVRPNTLRVAALTAQIRVGFRQLKALYPAATFPNVYFVIGRFNSGGTASNHGMLIGTDQMAGTADTHRDELSLWERNNLGSLEALPAVVAHEHIHFLQKSSPDRSLLRGAINEGMCDFLAELTAGQQPNARLLPYGNAHEKELWAAFKKEMAGPDWSNWIANGKQETAEKPADLGYYVGYRICRAYYEEMADKEQAIHDMLNITDYQAFLEKSRYEQKLGAR